MMSAGSMIGCEEVIEEAPRNATALIRCDTVVYWAPSEVSLRFERDLTLFLYVGGQRPNF